jgi:hypothetical protein
MFVSRPIAVAILLSFGPLLGSCSGFSGYVSDHWPHWAGGMPEDVPPRPGAPGYNEFISHGQTSGQTTGQTNVPPGQDATNSIAVRPPAKGDKPAVTTTKLTAQQTAPAPREAPAVPSQSSADPSVGNGGLY